MGFRGIDLRFQLCLDECDNVLHHSFRREFGFDEDNAVVRISCKMQLSSFQLLVEFIQIDVAQQRRKVSALWRSQIRFLEMPVDHDACSQEFMDKCGDIAVFRHIVDDSYELVLRNIVEEFLQVQVNYPFIPLVDEFKRSVYRILTSSSGSESI